jgi:hypothetical protein
MKLTVVLATLGAAIAMAAPNPGPAPAAAPEAEKAAAAAKKARDWSCLPPSCQVSGVSIPLSLAATQRPYETE